MFRLEWLFFMQILMGIFMIILLQKLTQMKKQVDEIVREVKNYITYVTEEIDEEINLTPKEHHLEKTVKNKIEQKEQDEAQNRLIQAVLGEYFP